MRLLLVSLLVSFFTSGALVAGKIDLAVIQFPENKAPADLEEALKRVSLFEITDADRTRTAEAYLKGGYVLFAQRLPVSLGASFWAVTRLKNLSADVRGRLEAGGAAISISLTEGVRAGLRTFQKSVYTGSGKLDSGVPRLLALRRTSGRFPSVIKGQTKMESFQSTTALVAQFSP